MEIILAITWALLGLMLFWRYGVQSKSEAERVCATLAKLINAEWKYSFWKSNRSEMGYSGAFCEGIFNHREVTCTYTKAPFGGRNLTLNAKPHETSKKITWLQPSKTYPTVYKQFSFIGNMISGTQPIQSSNIQLTSEECLKLLHDLDKACEIVESGNTEI